MMECLSAVLLLLSAAWIAFILPSFRTEESYPFINGTYHKHINYVQRNVYVDEEFSSLKNTSKKYSIIPCRFRTAVYDGTVHRLNDSAPYDPALVVKRSDLTRPADGFNHSYSLVLAISEESSVLDDKRRNTIQSMELFAKHFNARGVCFTASKVIESYCLEHGIDVIPVYLFHPSILLIHRSNWAGMPLLREILKTMQQLYRAEYYGYMNSDILISASIFPVLADLSKRHANGGLTDGFLVSSVVFDAKIYPSIPLDTPESYTRFINQRGNKMRPRSIHCSDFWIFHASTDFDVIGDVVIGRGWIDNYIVSLFGSLHRSLVDVTYGAIGLHQGFDTNVQRNKHKNQISLRFNGYCMKFQRLSFYSMASPEAIVAYWDRQQRLMVEKYYSKEARDAKIRELKQRTWESDLQMPRYFCPVC